jgi:5'-nucleotidase (lipoprotein e(P4) family)
MTRRRLVPLLALLLFAGCRTGGPAASPAAPRPPAAARPTATPAAPAPLSSALRWTRESAEHRAIFLQVYRSATAHVEREGVRRTPGTWAVAVDADETVIDNSVYQVEREKAGRPFTPESWREWTRRREAVGLPGAAAFLSRVRALGGVVAVVTNRREAECPDTEAVFRAHRLVYHVMLCRPDDGPGDKDPRLRSIVEGTTPARLPPLELVAVVGDNIHDFPGLDQAIREEDDSAFADFGARFFVLPNPMYGSWE